VSRNGLHAIQVSTCTQLLRTLEETWNLAYTVHSVRHRWWSLMAAVVVVPRLSYHRKTDSSHHESLHDDFCWNVPPLLRLAYVAFARPLDVFCIARLIRLYTGLSFAASQDESCFPFICTSLMPMVFVHVSRRIASPEQGLSESSAGNATRCRLCYCFWLQLLNCWFRSSRLNAARWYPLRRCC
jgi:hypothetical protein